MQTSASRGVDRKLVKYNNSAASAGNFQDPSEVAALYDEETDLVLIRDQTFTHSCRPRVDQTTRRPTGVTSDGIDCFGETLRHEWQHRTDWKAWWPPSALLPKGYSILEDPDLDGVPSSVENAEPGCSNLSKRSCTGRPFPDVSDREIYAYYAGWTWPYGSANREDWSCGTRGKQWGGSSCAP